VATGKIATIVEKHSSSTSPLHVDAQRFEPLAVSTEPLVASTVEDAHKSIFCFLVQVGDQQLLLPCHQIERISDGQREQTDVCYSLQELLGFPSEASPQSMVKSPESTSQHLLLLCSKDETMGGKNVGIVVDEVLGEQECVMEPLAAYLQRP